MLEYIKTIASLIKPSTELIANLKARHDEKDKRRLAQVLHLTYIRMNECITIGEQIIEVLKKFISKPDRKLYSNKYVIKMDGVVLEELMTRQIENLRNLGDSLVDFSEIIKVVDAALYTRLEQFIAEKGVGLDWIASLLERNQITFDGLRIDDVEELSKISDYFFQWYHHAGEISRRIEVNSLSVAALFINEESTSRIVLNQEQIHKLDTLIEQTDLNHHLEEAKKDMAVIKEFIGSNFSITDLMMDVGSHQLRKHRWPRPD